MKCSAVEGHSVHCTAPYDNGPKYAFSTWAPKPEPLMYRCEKQYLTSSTRSLRRGGNPTTTAMTIRWRLSHPGTPLTSLINVTVRVRSQVLLFWGKIARHSHLIDRLWLWQWKAWQSPISLVIYPHMCIYVFFLLRLGVLYCVFSGKYVFAYLCILPTHFLPRQFPPTTCSQHQGLSTPHSCMSYYTYPSFYPSSSPSSPSSLYHVFTPSLTREPTDVIPVLRLDH